MLERGVVGLRSVIRILRDAATGTPTVPKEPPLHISNINLYVSGIIEEEMGGIDTDQPTDKPVSSHRTAVNFPKTPIASPADHTSQ